jgi:hypothetical protein
VIEQEDAQLQPVEIGHVTGRLQIRIVDKYIPGRPDGTAKRAGFKGLFPYPAKFLKEA